MNREQLIRWMEKNTKIGNNPAKLYGYQEKLLLDDSRFRIVNKSRQVGMSLCVAFESLMDCVFNSDYCVLLISNSERQSINLLRYTYDLIWSFPKEVRDRLKFKEESKQSISFMNGSRIISLPNQSSTIRGFRSESIYLDEFAHFQNANEIFQAILPSISRGGKLTVLSTPLGKLSLFYDLWNDPEFSRHKIEWKDCPELIENIKEIRNSMDDSSFKTEYCAEFCDSVESYFTLDIIAQCVIENPLEELEDWIQDCISA